MAVTGSLDQAENEVTMTEAAAVMLSNIIYFTAGWMALLVALTSDDKK